MICAMSGQLWQRICGHPEDTAGGALERAHDARCGGSSATPPGPRHTTEPIQGSVGVLGCVVSAELNGPSGEDLNLWFGVQVRFQEAEIVPIEKKHSFFFFFLASLYHSWHFPSCFSTRNHFYFAFSLASPCFQVSTGWTGIAPPPCSAFALLWPLALVENY